MKSNKGMFSSVLLAIVTLLTSLNPSIAMPAKQQAIDDTQVIIKSATANDRIYLSYAPSRDLDDGGQLLAHYSHRSHSSHSSHYSHRSHYSSY